MVRYVFYQVTLAVYQHFNKTAKITITRLIVINTYFKDNNETSNVRNMNPQLNTECDDIVASMAYPLFEPYCPELSGTSMEELEWCSDIRNDPPTSIGELYSFGNPFCVSMDTSNSLESTPVNTVYSEDQSVVPRSTIPNSSIVEYDKRTRGVIKGNRIELRKFIDSEHDALVDAFSVILAEPRYFQNGPLLEQKKVEEWVGERITRWKEKPSWYAVCIPEPQSDVKRIIGGVGLDLDQSNAYFELGIVIKQDKTGNGFGSEALIYLLQELEQSRLLKEKDGLCATVHPDNGHSLALLKKFAFEECDSKIFTPAQKYETERKHFLRRFASNENVRELLRNHEENHQKYVEF